MYVCSWPANDCRGDPANRSDKLMVTPCRVRKVVHLLARSSPLPQTRNEPELLLGDQIHHMHRVRRVWASITSSLEGFPDPLTKWPSCLRKLGHCKDYAGVCDGYSSPTFARQSRLACVATSFLFLPMRELCTAIASTLNRREGGAFSSTCRSFCGLCLWYSA